MFTIFKYYYGQKKLDTPLKAKLTVLQFYTCKLGVVNVM